MHSPTVPSFTRWMAWEGGVDLVAATQPGLPMPNIIVHVARIVHTPVGFAPAGMVLVAPDPTAAPLAMGFVCPDATVGAYFGPHIFAGTPFEAAPCLDARIDIDIEDSTVGATISVGGHTIRTQLTGLGALRLVTRAPGGATPFVQQGLERTATTARLWCDGVEVPIIVPPVGISGGPAAVHAPCGIYAR